MARKNRRTNKSGRRLEPTASSQSRSVETLTGRIQQLSLQQTSTINTNIDANNVKFPGLISGHLPVELQLEIWSYLTAAEMNSVITTCTSARSVFEHNSTQIINTITNREINRLVEEADYLDFSRGSVIDNWHRYIDIFGLTRLADWGPDTDRFAEAIVQADEDLSGAEAEEQVAEFLNVCLAVSDWLQWYDHGATLTPLADELMAHELGQALATACDNLTQSQEFYPGAYGTIIGPWQEYCEREVNSELIAISFLELYQRPLQDLGRLPERLFMPWQDGDYGYKTLPSIGPDVEILPEFIRSELDGLVVPLECGCFSVLVGTKSERGKRLIELSRKMHEKRESFDGLLLAMLIEESNVYWM